MSSYYNASARKFQEDSMEVNMNEFYQPFLERLPETAVILDAGCGMGNDSVYFKNKGHYVIPMETSEDICQRAGENIGQSVLFCKFQDMHSKVKVNGIWACSSLVHVPSDELAGILLKFNYCLREGGVMYASFGYGDFEGEREDDYYTQLTEYRASRLFTRANFSIDRMWITEDTRENHQGEKYINIIAVK